MSETPVVVQVGDRVARIRLARPDAMNALSPELLQALVGVLEELARNEDLQVVTLEGEGRAFSVGFDLQAMASLVMDGGLPSEAALREAALLGEHVVANLRSLKAVTIASVHGYAIGGGFLLAAACDFRVVTDDVVFSLPEVDIGLPLAWGGVPLLVHELGASRVRDLVMTCRKFGPSDLVESGFVHHCVPDMEREARTEELVALLLEKPRLPLLQTKQQMLAGVTRSETEVSDEERFVEAVLHPEFLPTALAYLQRLRNR